MDEKWSEYLMVGSHWKFKKWLQGSEKPFPTTFYLIGGFSVQCTLRYLIDFVGLELWKDECETKSSKILEIPLHNLGNHECNSFFCETRSCKILEILLHTL